MPGFSLGEEAQEAVDRQVQEQVDDEADDVRQHQLHRAVGRIVKRTHAASYRGSSTSRAKFNEECQHR